MADKAKDNLWYDHLFKTALQRSANAYHVKEHQGFIARYCVGSVLDLGCGLGQVANLLNGHDYLGIDFSAFAIQYAETHCTNPRAHFMQMDLRLPSDSLEVHDTVIVSEVLEHVDDIEGLASMAKRLAKKRLIGTVPIHMPIKGHVKSTWTKEDIFKLFGARPLIIEQGCRNIKKPRIHWHFVYEK